eukprot:961178-Lingulodinium_polyedra.AAC.1
MVKKARESTRELTKRSLALVGMLGELSTLCFKATHAPPASEALRRISGAMLRSGEVMPPTCL